jgi:hypothetical protein
MVHAYHPSYEGSANRRIMAQPSLGINSKTLFEKYLNGKTLQKLGERSFLVDKRKEASKVSTGNGVRGHVILLVREEGKDTGRGNSRYWSKGHGISRKEGKEPIAARDHKP